jgi:hypothetical protein
MIFISMVSMLGSMFVATMIFTSKKLQVHPQRLIAYTCMSEAISSFNGAIWAMDTEYIVNYLDLNTFFARTVMFRTDEEAPKEALKKLVYANDFSF